ncbi:prefoldin subunit beta [archaeon]|nr:prefoldin subunit beta [archaeon]|tara:strand:- start:1755 stop:2084 length:330 start_codon:yes stop_codon:yes gene_type:complete
MKINKETQEKIDRLQLIEQNLQSILIQKQTFQGQLLEIENALKELTNKKDVYKIIGAIMVASKKEDLEKELNQKKEILDLRLKNIEKQEEKIKEGATELQSEVMKNLKE